MSETTGPYKSRIFNFISQQTLHFTEKCKHAVRQIKTSAIWGLEVVAYSLQAIVKSVQQAGKQIKSTPQQTAAKLPETPTNPNPNLPNSDTPIQNVIEAAQILVTSQQKLPPTTTTTTPQTNQHQLIIIQGIASLLQTKALILISNQNQTLEIPTYQQQKIKEKILLETAFYWKQKRQLTPTAPANPTPKQLTPSNNFNIFKTWLTLGPLGVTATLLQDAALLANPKKLFQKTQSAQIEIQIENNNQTTPITPPENLPNTLLKNLQKIALELVTNPSETNPNKTSKIQNFLETTAEIIVGKPQNSQEQPLTKNTNDGNNSDSPWLNVPNLFNKTELATDSMNISLNDSSTHHPKQTLKKIITEPVNRHSTNTQKPPQQKTLTQPKIESSTEWIDIPATTTGYVKHPLEKLLEWLDRGLLFLEEIILAILQWFKK